LSSEIELIGRINHLTATIPLSKCAPASPALLNPFLFIRGLSCSGCIQASLSLNCLKLTIPGFPYNCLPVSCGDIGFKKSLGLVLAWKSALKVPLLPLRRYCPLQTILLSDLVGCDSPLQIVMATWRTIIVSRGLSHPTQKVQIQTKRAPTAITICRRLSHPTGRATLPSDNIRGFFQGCRNPLMI
jgi:hypothetical protein